MKKIILGSLIGFVIISVAGFKIATYEPKQNTSEVEEMEGFYIFYKSKPVKEYERIGHYKIEVTWSGTPENLLKQLIHKSVKKYPNGNGLIITENLEECDIIKIEK